MEEIPLKHFAFKQISPPLQLNCKAFAQSNDLGLIALASESKVFLVKSQDLFVNLQSENFSLESLSVAHFDCHSNPPHLISFSNQKSQSLLICWENCIFSRSIQEILADPKPLQNWNSLFQGENKIKKICTSSQKHEIAVLEERGNRVTFLGKDHLSWENVLDCAWSPSERLFGLLKTSGDECDFYSGEDFSLISSLTLEEKNAFSFCWLSEDVICCSHFSSALEEEKLEHSFVSLSCSFPQIQCEDFTFVPPEPQANQQISFPIHMNYSPFGPWKGTEEEFPLGILAASSRSTEISIFLSSTPPSVGFVFEEDDRAVLPIDNFSDQETFPIALAVDFTVKKPFEIGEETFQTPLLWILTSVGCLLCYRIFKNDSFECPLLVSERKGFLEMLDQLKEAKEESKEVKEESKEVDGSVQKEFYESEDEHREEQLIQTKNEFNKKEPKVLDHQIQTTPTKASHSAQTKPNAKDSNSISNLNPPSNPKNSPILAPQDSHSPIIDDDDDDLSIIPKTAPPTPQERLSELKNKIQTIVSTKSPSEAFPLLFSTATCGFSAHLEELHARVRLLWNIRDKFNSSYPSSLDQFISTISTAEHSLKSILLYLTDLKQSSHQLAKRIGRPIKSKSTFSFDDQTAEVQNEQESRLVDLFDQISLAPELLEDELVMALSGISIGEGDKCDNISMIKGEQKASFLDLKAPPLKPVLSNKLSSEFERGISQSLKVESAISVDQSKEMKLGFPIQQPVKSAPIIEQPVNPTIFVEQSVNSAFPIQQPAKPAFPIQQSAIPAPVIQQPKLELPKTNVLESSSVQPLGQFNLFQKPANISNGESAQPQNPFEPQTTSANQFQPQTTPSFTQPIPNLQQTQTTSNLSTQQIPNPQQIPNLFPQSAVAFGTTSALAPPNPALYNSPSKPAPNFSGFGNVSSFNSSTSSSPFKSSMFSNNASGFGGAFGAAAVAAGGSAFSKETSPFASIVSGSEGNSQNSNDSSQPSSNQLSNAFSTFRF